MFKKFGTLALVGVTLSACAMGGPKQTGGTLLGGAAGALVGSQFGGGNGQLVGVALGTMLGAFAGSEIGKSLDDNDKRIAHDAAQNSFETARTGQRSSWKNPDSGNSGEIVVTKTKGQCREFTQTVLVGGKRQEAYGTACRQKDGAWKIQS